VKKWLNFGIRIVFFLGLTWASACQAQFAAQNFVGLGSAWIYPQLTMHVHSMGGVGTFQIVSLSSNVPEMTEQAGYYVHTDSHSGTAHGRTVRATRFELPVKLEFRASSEWRLLSATCETRYIGGSMKPRAFGMLTGDTLLIPGIHLMPLARIHCTFTVGNMGDAVFGQIVLDNGKAQGHAHNAVLDDDEVGQAGVRVQLSDCASRILSQAYSGPDGRFYLDSSRRAGYRSLCIDQFPPTGHHAVSRASGSVTFDTEAPPTQLRFNYRRYQSMDRLVFGNVPNGSLSGAGTQAMEPGERRVLPLVYLAGTEGDVVFEFDPPRPPDGWVQTLFMDTGCSGAWSPDAKPIAGQMLFVTAGDRICLLASLDSPVTGNMGSAVQFDVKATEMWHVPTLNLFGMVSELRSTGTAKLAQRSLVLHKEWRAVPTCPLDADHSLRDPTPFQTLGAVPPGGRVEFRVRYRNPGSRPVKGISLSDLVPDQTVFETAFCGAIPADGIRACWVTVQPAVAGVGPIAWQLVDDVGPHAGLRSAGQGSVGYCLRLRSADGTAQ